MNEASRDVGALAAEREERRRAKDFAAADALRARIEALGYRILDGAEGPTLEPIRAARERAADVPSMLGDPATADATLAWVDEGWPQDIRRAVEATRASAAGRAAHLVVADATGGDAHYGDDVEVLRLEPGTGWAAARNAGLRRAKGRIVVALDGSIEPVGDLVTPLLLALEDPSVGICGPFGISTIDLREFHESPGPVVDAIEGYCFALRRELLVELGGFDERFRWYRTADIELSFRAKDAGYRCVVVEVPVRKHEHRMWDATTPEDRDRLSKRNYNRFLERFRGRTDLLVGGTEGG
ncbi:MAG TPA: glycosyltransferase [Actinomycetota bacterium]|nr:glycosyltransferase [Actinomycetota bacterium]